MQLIQQKTKSTTPRNIALVLAQASAVLLSQTAAAAPMVDSKATAKPWNIDVAGLVYSEADGRVQAFEPVVNVSKDYGDERIFNGKLVIDSLTGATPFGAAPANVAQTITGPTAKVGAPLTASSLKQVAAGETPLDDTFKDTRVAVNVAWSQPLAENYKGGVSANISSEYDFKSVGLAGNVSRDLNNKNTTVTGALALEYDQIQPVGGTPNALVDLGGANSRNDGNETKSVVDAMVGVTQLLNQNALFTVNYGLSSSQGYMNDPYKILTVVDSAGMLMTPAGTNANTYRYVYESRPDTRLRHTLFGQLKYHLGKSIVDASYRFSTDDWGVTTHTLEGKYRINLMDNRYYVEPHVRIYQQSDADFYHGYLKLGDTATDAGGKVTTPSGFASADARLGGLTATTLGLKVAKTWGDGRELSLRVEQYSQSAKDRDATTVGSLANLQLQPDLTATMAQVAYRFKW
jgi:hypothetical protein